MMSDKEIKDAINSGKLIIKPFLLNYLQPSSYDLRLGPIAYLGGKTESIDIEHTKQLSIQPGQFALVTTLEEIKMPPDMAAHIGMSSRLTRKGLLLLHGVQIDPGFEGKLVLGLYNASPRELGIQYTQRFCTIVFHRLGTPSEKPYKPSTEELEGVIPWEDIQYIQALAKPTRTLSELDGSVRKLEQKVNDLSNGIVQIHSESLPKLSKDLTDQILIVKKDIEKSISTLQSWVQWGGATFLAIFCLFAGVVIYFLFDLAKAIP